MGRELFELLIVIFFSNICWKQQGLEDHFSRKELTLAQQKREDFKVIMAVVNQPGKYEPSEFQTGMLDCCDDIGICCFGYFCFCCLGCSIASDMGECCLCGLGMPIRSVYRTKYNIKGSMCNDYMVTMCCPLCTTCQLKRDINRRKEQGIF